MGLNLLRLAVIIAYVHVSLMVNLHRKNQKLIERGISVVGE